MMCLMRRNALHVGSVRGVDRKELSASGYVRTKCTTRRAFAVPPSGPRTMRLRRIVAARARSKSLPTDNLGAVQLRGTCRRREVWAGTARKYSRVASSRDCAHSARRSRIIRR